jgi:hypothetical protein
MTLITVFEILDLWIKRSISRRYPYFIKLTKQRSINKCLRLKNQLPP